MNRKCWTCKLCGKIMVKTSDKFMACTCDSKLQPLWCVGELLIATRHDYKRFVFEGGQKSTDWYVDFYEYVPHAHVGCMDRAPEKGYIIGRVMLNDHYRPMIFRPAKPSKAVLAARRP